MTLTELFAHQCLKCGRLPREMACLIRVRTHCNCTEVATISCKCGWCGPATKTTKRTSYVVVECPECGNAVQSLTDEKRQLIERETGRDAGDHLAIVKSVIARKFSRCSPGLREELLEVGSRCLVIAMIRWNPDRGYRFSTYATSYVHGRLLNVLRDEKVRRARESKLYRYVRTNSETSYESDFDSLLEENA